ncbi:family 16 glycosylhydrolase [Shouchella sp. JSM 1781072]|uniref:glycoside hydrolase family 16 protein n=1 Tax=Shouchella sp. JSM 1781072 TaxID=3344581 RepID=UPI0035BF597D
MKKMLGTLSIAACATFIATSYVGATETEEDLSIEQEGWNLVWNDEFDGDSLDQSKWRYDIGNGQPNLPGWGNEELQYYNDDPRNVRVENGELIIEAHQEPISDEFGSYEYTSGKVLTEGLFSQTYGRFEARMRLPAGQGFWPAFWMMPENDQYGGWAASGEIDIMENAGGTPYKVGGAIHYGGPWPENQFQAGDYFFPDGTDATGYHEYAVEWEPGEIRWYVDGNLYQTINDWYSTGGAYPAPFDQDFHLILNLAVGGWYGGNPDGSTPFPSTMAVDYVRVYER